MNTKNLLILLAVFLIGAAALNTGTATYTPTANSPLMNWDCKINGNTTQTFVSNLNVFPETVVSSGAYCKFAIAQNSEMRIPFYSPDSIPHTLSIYFQAGTDEGIASVSINGVSQGTIDMYGSPGSSTKTLTVTPINGVNILSIIMSTKNVSSSSYNIQIMDMWID